MGGVDVSQGRSRSVNSDINMVPFIDLLLVTIAFLLITAVWVTHSRIETNASVPGPPTGEEIDVDDVATDLHVFAHETEFVLAWKQGATIVSETRLPRKVLSDGISVDHSELAQQITAEFARHGSYKDVDERRRDVAVVHADNQLPFRQLVALMDAIHDTKRARRNKDGEARQVSAFSISFASR